MELIRHPVHRALTRPQMFAGVTYNFFIINAGEPPRTSSVGESGDFDASASMQANEREHIFRRAFFLDQPTFFNTRYGLRDEEILWLLASPERPWEIPADRRAAFNRLDDYGRVIVPHLLRIAAVIEEPGALDRAIALAVDWFARHLGAGTTP